MRKVVKRLIDAQMKTEKTPFMQRGIQRKFKGKMFQKSKLLGKKLLPFMSK